MRLDELVRRHRRNVHSGGAAEAAGSPLVEAKGGFGSNPGALRMLSFVPEGLPAGAPLVVVLHGCTQTAAGYDRGTGWSALARQLGFALLLPEQRTANNHNRCLNWFEPGDTARGAGEALSIRQMVTHMLAGHRLDPARVFVTGLSAGGAMTSVMLATYPEVFAAGAIVAGLPYGAAANMQQAFEAMASGRPRPGREWGDLVRAASPHRGPWPRVSVWQGEADTTVRPVNAAQILRQWRDLHGITAPPRLEGATGGGHLHRVWRDTSGRAVLEHHSIAGLAHGVPIHPGPGPERGGVAAPHILDVGVSSTWRIAGFFGLAEGRHQAAAPSAAAMAAARPAAAALGVIRVGQDGEARVAAAPEQRPGPERPEPGWSGPEAGGPGAVIRRALQAAGLLKP